jgi:hypothetical protein
LKRVARTRGTPTRIGAERNTVRTVKIRRDAFVEKVAVNRAEHRAVFEKALDGYQRRLVRELDSRIADVKAGRRIEHYIRLPEPADHTDDYDRILAMAEMSVDEVVELDADDFARFVMDQWSWKHDFTDTTTFYDDGRQGRRAGRG